MSAVEVNRLSVVFGRGAGEFRAVDDANLKVAEGSTLGVVGESGSGKTTIARVIAGLQRPSAGEVVVAGIAIDSSARARQAGVQMVFQNPYGSLNPRMTVGSALREVRGLRLLTGDQRSVQVLLDMVRLPASAADKYPGELSGGMRQRVAIARALAAEPRVLVADEVTSALDVSVQGAVINTLRELQREIGFTMVFISHNLAIVDHVSDQIAVMYRGSLVEHAAADDVMLRPEHPYTRLLLASIPGRGGIERFSAEWEHWVTASGGRPTMGDPVDVAKRTAQR